MTRKMTMYPTGVSQPNRNKSSGLQGKCFKAVTRGGSTYSVDCSLQRDPKYHHEWSDAEEILKGKTIQCGRPSTRMCSHSTYYGIKGYRNTCPIAGVSGTYTQPATLRLSFDLSKKGVSSTAKIEKVEVSFEHRCVGVDVANGKTSTAWGPNFHGFNHYTSRKALTLKLGSQTKYLEKNPPLSNSFSSTGTFVFKNVSYKDLKNGLDVIYGNNLETNPGNIYIRGLKATIHYEDEKPYLEGSQKGKSLYISEADTCRSQISFSIEAGYKQGKTKIDIEKAPKNLRNFIKITTPKDVIFSETNDNKNKRKKIYTITDKSSKAGKKKVKFEVKGVEDPLYFTYEAVKRKKPSISIPTQIEKNVLNTNTTSIVASNGCSKEIKAYKGKISSSTLLKTFTNLNISNQKNIIPNAQIQDFYRILATLPCGTHKIYFRRDNEPLSEAVLKTIKVIPTEYKFYITKEGDNKVLQKYETIQNKTQNESLKLVFVKTKNLITPPRFVIENPTHGKEENGEPTKDIINNINWNLTQQEAQNGGEYILPLGTYYPGEYTIKVKDRDTNCKTKPFEFEVNISPFHKQYYDEIFVRGEDSTSFDYDYLVALEGDSITEPIYVNTVSLGASYKDIKICSSKNNITGLGQMGFVEFSIKNVSNRDIENLLLELNPLIKDEDDLFVSSPAEWLESDGIFYNFKENFENINSFYNEIITVKNLNQDEDLIDEEDVYFHIKKIKAKEEIPIKIPFACSIEKEVYLQILLFGQPMILYEQGNCSDETRVFNKILVQVYDSILTSMDIQGNNDLFETELVPDCPNECFKTEMKYIIKNIDSSGLSKKPKTIISNDPRLVPYKIKYNEKEYEVTDDINNFNFSNIYITAIEDIENENTYSYIFYDDEEQTNEIGRGLFEIGSSVQDFLSINILTNDLNEDFINKIFYLQNDFIADETLYQLYESNEIKYNTIIYEQGEAERDSIISGARVDAYIQFKDHEETHLHQYTNYDGETTFFVTIPQTVGETFTIEKLLKHMSIEFKGDNYYNGKKYIPKESQYYINIENGTGEIEIPSLPEGQYIVSITKDNITVLDKKILTVTNEEDVQTAQYNSEDLGDYSSTNVSLSFNQPNQNEIPIISVDANEDGEYIIKVDDYLYKDDNTRHITFYPSKNMVEIEVFENQIDYLAGQTVPIPIKLIGKIKYLQNNLIFYPDIRKSGEEDSLTVYYQICNLDKNRGKLTTIFKTDDYKLIENEMVKRIYCGMDTNLILYTRLSKIIVENKSLNRLSISLENKERNNKNIEVVIEEEMPIEKYDMINSEIDNGTIIIDNNKIIWKIDYIEEDTTIRGYIDFKAKEIGYSKMKTSVTDFLDKEDPRPLFGEDSYKCDCRKVI